MGDAGYDTCFMCGGTGRQQPREPAVAQTTDDSDDVRPDFTVWNVSNTCDEPDAQNEVDMSCELKELPAELRAEAADNAIRENPQNAAPPSPELHGLMALLPPDRLAVFTAKKWRTGKRLGVKFLDTSNLELRRKLLVFMNQWSSFADIGFVESTSSQAEVRLTLSGGGYWSYLGTDLLSIPSGQPTMSLSGFSLSTSESEWNRVVPHEAGHALGFPHEHFRQEIIELLDRERTIRYFMQTQGWSRADVIAQVLTPPSPGSIMASAVADVRSIMCYSFPGSVTKSGLPILGGAGLDAIDKEFVGKVYPLTVSPPPPPPPPPGGTITLTAPLVPTAVAFQVADVKRQLEAAGWVVAPPSAE